MGHKILLADDSITIQKVIELTFSDEDFELHTVGNGQKAIDEIRTITPDIVLCDIIMPEKNGYEVCEFIKSNDDLKHIPVLLLTGAFEPFDQERAKAAGCEGFLAKPFEPQTLIAKVRELLAAGAGAPAAAAPAPAAVSSEMPSPGLGDDHTVMVPPDLDSQPPQFAAPAPNAPQIVAPSSPPPAALGDAPPGLDQGFVAEAGARELAMEPDDHTMLLGDDGTGAAKPPAATPPDDIWSTPEPEPTEGEGATVFLSSPPPGAGPGFENAGMDSLPEPPAAAPAPRPGNDPDATWQMPSPESGDAPANDFGGFEDFAPPAAPESTPPEPPQAVPPPIESPKEPFAPMESMEPMAPVEPTPSAMPSQEPEPSGSIDTGATIDPVVAHEPLEPIAPPPMAPPEPPARSAPPPPPQVAAPPAPPVSPDTFEPVVPEVTPVSSSDSKPQNVGGGPMMSDATDGAASPVQPAAVPEQPAVAASQAGSNTDDELVDRIAQRVVDKLSEKVIQEIAWEVVPDLAEGLIQKEIDALKAKIPK